jgi:hypothetical protein
MEPTSFQSPLPPPRSLDYELSNILTRLSDCESYVSGWVSTLLQTTEALQSDIAAIKEQKPTAPPPLSFRQLIELHHLQIISKDEIRSLLRVPEALAETNQEWTSLFTIDSEPKSVSAGLSLVDVIPTTQADNQAINNALDTLFPPSPPEPDL